MSFKKLVALLSLFFLVACASQDSKPLPEESQKKVEEAQFRTKPELAGELALVIENSDLKSSDKDELLRAFEKFVEQMATNLIEQNKIVSAIINNLSSVDSAGMKAKADLIRRYEAIEKDSTNKRMAILNKIAGSLQGKISAEKIEKINALLNVRRFLIIESIKK